MPLSQLASSKLDAGMVGVSKEANASPQRLVAAYNAAVKSAILDLDTAAQEGGTKYFNLQIWDLFLGPDLHM